MSTMAPFSITHPADWIRDESKNPLEAEGDVVWKTPEGVEILSVHWCENPPEAEKILKTMSSKKSLMTSTISYQEYKSNN